MAIITIVANGHSDDLNVLRNGEVSAGLIFNGRWFIVGRARPVPMAGEAKGALVSGLTMYDQSASLLPRYRKYSEGFETLEAAITAILKEEKDEEISAAAGMAKALRKAAKRQRNTVWP